MGTVYDLLLRCAWETLRCVPLSGTTASSWASEAPLRCCTPTPVICVSTRAFIWRAGRGHRFAAPPLAHETRTPGEVGLSLLPPRAGDGVPRPACSPASRPPAWRCRPAVRDAGGGLPVGGRRPPVADHSGPLSLLPRGDPRAGHPRVRERSRPIPSALHQDRGLRSALRPRGGVALADPPACAAQQTAPRPQLRFPAPELQALDRLAAGAVAFRPRRLGPAGTSMPSGALRLLSRCDAHRVNHARARREFSPRDHFHHLDPEISLRQQILQAGALLLHRLDQASTGPRIDHQVTTPVRVGSSDGFGRTAPKQRSELERRAPVPSGDAPTAFAQDCLSRLAL